MATPTAIPATQATGEIGVARLQLYSSVVSIEKIELFDRVSGRIVVAAMDRHLAGNLIT